MNTEETSTSSSGKSYYPVMLLSVSVAIYLVYQMIQISGQHDAINNASKQLEDIRANTIPRYEDGASKARQVEGVLNNLAGDVYKLATDGKDDLALKIVQAHGIKYNAPQGNAAPTDSGTH